MWAGGLLGGIRAAPEPHLFLFYFAVEIGPIFRKILETYPGKYSWKNLGRIMIKPHPPVGFQLGHLFLFLVFALQVEFS